MEMIRENSTKQIVGLTALLAFAFFIAALALSLIDNSPPIYKTIQPVTSATDGEEETTPTPTNAKQSLPIFSGQKSVLLKIPHIAKKIFSTFEFDGKSRSGTIYVTGPDYGNLCAGIFRYTTIGAGSWSLDCQQEITLNGNLTYNGNAEYFIGQGQDFDGNRITFYLDANR